MDSETKFVPQWLQAKQNDSTPNGPSRGADRFFMAAGSRDRENGRPVGKGTRPNNNPVKYQLAEHRYGREEMLALFDPSNAAPDDLGEHPVYVAESLNPISLTTMTEEEEVLSLQNVNSYGYKPYLRGGAMRGGIRGDYGRGRGRGRDDEGRMKLRDSWDDRPSKSHDYSGHDDGPSSSHKTDFFSPSSHNSLLNRSNSNDSWRSRNNFQDADNGEFRKERWSTKAWRDAKTENRLQEEGSFFKGASPRDPKPTDFKRSKSLYEEDETAHKMPEWSTVDKEDLGVEGSFDSSGAFMTSKLKESKKAEDDSVKKELEPNSEAKSHPVREDPPSKAQKGPTEEGSSEAAVLEGDRRVSLPAACSHASTKVINPVADILPTVSKEETDQNVLFSNMKIDDPRASLVFRADDCSNPGRNVVASSFPHPIAHPASLPTVEQSTILAHSSLVHLQPFSYTKNSWYYVDPQGATQGPFRDSDMAEWYYQGYFDMTLMLKAGDGGEFMNLGAFVTKVGSLPFAPNRPALPGQPQPMQNVPQSPCVIANHVQHRVDVSSHEILPQTFFYPRQPSIPQQPILQQPILQQQQHPILQQQPMQSPEPPSNSFLPTMHLGATNVPNNLFVSGPVHMPSLNGDIPNKTAWNQTQPSILQDKNMSVSAFNSMLPPNAPGLWNPSLLVNEDCIVRAATVQEVIPVDYHIVQQLEKLEAEKERRRKATDAEQMAIVERMVAEKVAEEAKMRKKQMEEQERKELLKQEESKLREEQSKREEEKRTSESQKRERNPDQMLLEMLRQEEGMDELRRQEEAFAEIARQRETLLAENMNEEEFKPVEDAKKVKENKKRKEAKKQEEARKQEEIRRQEESRLELVRKMEEQKKAEEMKKKEEEEQILKMRLAAEEAKRKELEEMNLRKQISSKNAWASNRSQPSSNSGIPKMNEIQNIEHEKMKQQQMAEQKLIAEQQKQLASIAAVKTAGWKSNPVKTAPPKSLLDIQMEQASQLEVPVKIQQQQQVVKAVDHHPPSSASRAATKERPNKVASVARAPETGKDSAWEAAITSGLKKHQKLPTLDNNQFPALHPGKPSAAGKKLPLKALGKSARDEIAAQKVFEAVKVKDELTEWCEKSLAGIKTEVDISTLVDFLKSLKNSSEILEYIHNYLGDSKVVKDFAKQFVEKMNNYSQDNNSWSVVGRQGNGSNNKSGDRSGDKTAKKGKKKQQKVDANFLLGFTVRADPDRTNVGEIDAVPGLGSKK